MQYLVALSLTVAASAALLARTPAPSPAQADQQRIAVEATTVVVDVVVRDRRGRPVTDLTADDFQVFEDGVRQRVASFSLISADDVQELRGAPVRVEADAAPPAGGGIGVTALVFDRLSPEGRTLARQAAASFIEETRAADLTGVFAIDLSLRTVQPYTADSAVLRAAVDDASTLATGGFAGRAEPAPEGPLPDRGGDTPVQIDPTAARTLGAGAVTAAIATAAVAQREQELVDRMEQAYDSLSRDQQGYSTTNALLAVVHSLQLLPGRKTLVFFSEGLAIPPGVVHHFQSVVDTANRANVSIYTLDAVGLRIHSSAADTRTRLREETLLMDDARRAGMMMRSLERNEDLLRGSPESGLGMLAEQTGGFLITNTNDLRPGVRRIDEDRRFHYLLGYTPTNTALDGQFREIAVEVNRPGVEVRARPGYHAVRSAGPMPVLSYEAPALAILDGPTLPTAFPLRTAAVSLPDPKRPGLTPVMVAMGTESLAFFEDPTENRYTADFTVLVRLLDASGGVAHKLSQRYHFEGPIDEIPLARQGEVIFYRQPELAPGVYTLEAIAYDAIADRASGRVATVEVPPPAERGPYVSLMLIQRSEQVPAAERDPDNPLYVGELLLYPHLGEPFRKGTDAEVPFFVAIHPGEGRGRPQAALQLRYQGQQLAELPVQLPAPTPKGRIEYTGRLPLDPLPPGSYELAMVVTAGGRETVRTTPFIVTDR